MGGSGSKLFSGLSSSRITSKQDLATKTKDTTDMADALFQFMYANFEPKEIWDISVHPELYVSALSEMIEAQFNILGYATDRTVQGEIYFEKYEDLKYDKWPSAKQEAHKKNCQIIAFFFIRVFQILGAVLMVVKQSVRDVIRDEGDDRRSSWSDERSVLGERRIPRVNYSQRGGAPQLGEAYQRGGAPQWGGALVSSDTILGPFEFLRWSLEDPSDDEKRLATDPSKNGYSLYKVKDTNLLLRFKPFDKFKSITKESINDDNPEFIVLVKRGETADAKPVKIKVISIFPRDLSPTTLVQEFQFRIAQINPRGGRPKNDDEENKIIITHNDKDDVETRRRTYSISKTPFTVSNFIEGSVTLSPSIHLKYILENIFFYKYILPITAAEGRTYSKLQTLDIKKTDADQQSKTVAEPGTVVDFKKITNPMVADTGRKLLEQNGSAHCVNRALQLLNASSIMDSTLPAHTKVCTFSVPGFTATTSLDKYEPTRTLAQLYGKINIKSGLPLSDVEFAKAQKVLTAFVSRKDSSVKGDPLSKGDIGDSVEKDSLQRALERLQTAFDVTKGAKLDGFGDISIASPKECANLDPVNNPLEEGKGHRLDKDSNLVRQLRDASQELLAYHVNKTVVLSDFLKELFTIKQRPNGTWEVKGINIKYLVLGFKGLDILTDQAREILVDYYEGCETIFQKKGLSKFKEVFKGEVADAGPAAAAAVPTEPAVPTVPTAPPAPVPPAPRPPV
jgi:hypothetical protein